MIRPCLVLLAAATSLTFAGAGCVARRSGVGSQCEVNSECATPLVCRLGYCRAECVTSADCPARLSCVLDALRIGSCQLERETRCTLPSDCPTPLVCRFMQCTNACETDRDCPGGSRCERGPDGAACIDRSTAPCVRDSDCDVLGVGGAASRCVQGRCREECQTDRDCRNDFWCDDGTGLCLPLPRFARPDAGRDAVSIGSDAPVPVPCEPMPFPLAWEYTEPLLIAGTRFELAGRTLVLVASDDSSHRGGAVLTLDLDTHLAFTRTPFVEAHPVMDIATDGTRVVVTGGSDTLEGGPERDLFEIVPSTGAATALGFMDAEERSSGALAFCGRHVVRAGGLPGGFGTTGSSVIDLHDLDAPGTSIRLTLPVPVRQLAIAASPTHVYLLGGASFPAGTTPRPSNRLMIIDCDAGTSREIRTPWFYGSTPGGSPAQATFAAVRDGRLYVWGLHYPDDTTSPGSLRFETIDILDLATETWETRALPESLRASSYGDMALVGDRIFRLGENLSMLDLRTGSWRCFDSDRGTRWINERVFSDGTNLYTVQIDIFAAVNEYRVRAYTLP